MWKEELGLAEKESKSKASQRGCGLSRKGLNTPHLDKLSQCTKYRIIALGLPHHPIYDFEMGIMVSTSVGFLV